MAGVRDGFHQAESEEERRAVYRFRYDVYVEEMGRYRDVADHENRLFAEPEDAYSRISYVAQEGRVVGTARLTWGALAPIPERMIEQYGLAPFLADLPPEAISVGERAMVAPHLRGSDLLLEMMGRGIRFANEHGIQLSFGNCEPHLLNLYLGLGHRPYSDDNVNSPSGYLIRIVFANGDLSHLRRIRSPLLEYLEGLPGEAPVPACLDRILSRGTTVTSPRLTSSRAYWSEVHGALAEIGGRRLSALDGMSEDEAQRCLAKSNIIECDAGDRVLKKGGSSRNLFVVLEGDLEVRDGDETVARLGPGDVFGEIAFLLERPRTMDVFAASDHVRVLSLSESLIRDMIDDDATVAAQLMLNVAKMLCVRLLQKA
jgi:CRP-like cAMP-binding protein